MNFRKYSIQGLLFLTAVPIIFIFSQTSCSKKNALQKEVPVPARIISLAPSITETLFALNLGDKVVGVTNFCNFPSEVSSIAGVGGLMDPNFEAILTLKPDLVVLMKENSKVKNFLHKKEIAYLAVDNHDIQAILESVILIGGACGKEKEAKLLRKEISDEIVAASCTSEKKYPKPKVLLCVGREGAGAGSISTIWVAGANTYYNELICAAGGINVITDTSISSMDYLTLSSEGIIRLKPDVIIDVMANMYRFSSKKLKKDWEKLTMVPAVKNGMIYCLSGDYVTIPGPRIVLLLKDIKTVIGEYFERK